MGGLLTLLISLLFIGAGATTYFLIRSKKSATMDMPTVVITEPKNRSEVMLYSPVTIQAVGSAAGGIQQLELWEGRHKISGIAGSDKRPLPELSASFQWLPTEPGQHILEVRAYALPDNRSTSARVTINVIDSQSMQPALPNGTMMLITKANLFVRAGPGETYPTLGSLPAGVSVAGLGQSGDQQWWQIRFDDAEDQTGWIPANPDEVTVLSDDTVDLQEAEILPPSTVTPTATATTIPTSTPIPTATLVPQTVAPESGPSQGSGPPDQAGGPGGPGGMLPQEALTACSGLAENDSCKVNTPMGTQTGTCTLLQEQLACMPEGGPPGMP